MEIGSTTTFATPVQQVRAREDEPARTPSQEQGNTSNEQAANTAQEPANEASSVAVSRATTGAEANAAVAQQPQQNEAQPSAVREAIESLGEPEPAKTNSELFQERATGADTENTRLEPQSITELATSAFEQRQTERAEDRTREQAQLRERFATGDSNSTTERFVDVNA